MDTLFEHRALLTKGISNDQIYQAIERQLEALSLPPDATLIDVGAGRGYLWGRMQRFFTHYVGVDAVRHEDFPEPWPMIIHNLDQPGIPLEDASGDVVICCETTPCLENPRSLFREMVRLVKPGGWIVVTNPNNLNLLSMITLVLRQRFNRFQDLSYPYMITPLLPCDLLRMSAENNVEDASIFYTLVGRIAFTTKDYPRWLAQIFPRWCSDHCGVIGRKPR